MDVLPFWPTATRNRFRTLSLPPYRNTMGTLQSSVFGPKFILLVHSRKNQVAMVRVMSIRREQAPNMVNYQDHMEPFQLAGGCTVLSTLSQFITYSCTIPMPTSWQTTSSICLWHPACSRREHPERHCASGAEWFQYPQQVPLQAFQDTLNREDI